MFINNMSLNIRENNPLRILDFAVFLQQQRYTTAILFLFYVDNGLSLSTFLLFQSIFYFTNLIAEIPAGYIGDIFSRKKVLVFSYLLFILRIVLWIIAPNLHTILAGEILYGLSKAFYRGVSDGYIYDYLKEHNTSNLMLNKYGKYNFCMSFGTAVSCLLGAFLYKYVGFKILLCIELFYNTTAIFTLFFLPNIKQKKYNYSFVNHVKNIFNSVKATFINENLKYHIIYAGILFGMTSIFAWNFQPFMKSFGIPATLFGVVYFINHILRGGFSLFADGITKKVSLNTIGFLSWILYILGFAAMIWASNYNNKYLCILTLLFICFAIGIQMIFNVSNISRIHSLISSQTRATISSANSMIASLCSGLFLMIFKYLVDYRSVNIAIFIFMTLFMFVLLIISKIQKLDKYVKNDISCNSL